MTTRAKTAQRSRAPQKTNESRLAYLIEDTLERSEIVIAAQNVSDKFSDIAQDLGAIGLKDVAAMADGLTDAFGPEVSQKFVQTATDQINQLVASVQASKTALDGEIARLKQGIETGEVSDMAMDAAATPMMPQAEPGAPDDMPPEGGDPAAPPVDDAAGGLPDAPPGGEAPPMGDAGGGPALGRAKKESAQPRGRAVREDAGMVRSHEGPHFSGNLQNLSAFHGGAGKLATSIANMIRADKLSEQQRKGLSNVLSHLAAFAAEPSHWSGIDADKKLEMALHAADIWDVSEGPVQKIVAQLKRLTHLLSAKHDDLLESRIRTLRNATDPDALILRTFRISLRENRDGQMAAIRTARTFAIDIEDVARVVKEAARNRPFASRRLREADADMKGDVPIFPVETGGTAVQGDPNKPANQSDSTTKPLSPAEARAKQQQQNAPQQQTCDVQQAQTTQQNQTHQNPQNQTHQVTPTNMPPNAPPQSTGNVQPAGQPQQVGQPRTTGSTNPAADPQQSGVLNPGTPPFKAPGTVVNNPNDPGRNRGRMVRS